MDPETLLIVKILQTGDLKKVLDLGIKPEHFSQPEMEQQFEWILQYYRDPSHPMAVPTVDVFKMVFPNVMFSAYDERLTMEEVVSLAKSKQFQVSLRKIGEQLYESSLDTSPAQHLFSAEDASRKLMDLLCRDKKQDVGYVSEQARLILGEYESKKRGEVHGIFWPWHILNEKAGEIENGNMVLLYGRPKQLKTWVGIIIMTYYYEFSFSGRCLLYSCEMPEKQIRGRVASRLARVPYGDYRLGRLGAEDEIRMYDVLLNLRQSELNSCTNGHKKEIIITYPGPDAGLVDLQAKIEAYSPDIVMVDGVQYLSSGKAENKNDWKFQSMLSRRIKDMAMQYHLPIIAVHQANRSQGQEVMEDVAFSDSWPRDADFAIKVHKIRTPDMGNILALSFSGAREFDLTGIYVHGKPGHNFDYIDEIPSMESLMEYIKKNKKKNAAEGCTVRKSSELVV